jgi:hypothetical protein
MTTIGGLFSSSTCGLGELNSIHQALHQNFLSEPSSMSPLSLSLSLSLSLKLHIQSICISHNSTNARDFHCTNKYDSYIYIDLDGIV